MNLIPSISAFCLERIAQLKRLQPEPTVAIKELEGVVGYCEALNTQAEVMDGMVNKALGGTKALPGELECVA